MPYDFAIPPIHALGASTPLGLAPQRASSNAVASAPPVRVRPNPTLRLDAGLGMVVIEFLGQAGDVISSIPTQRQIEAYRTRTQAAPDSNPSAQAPKVSG